MADTGKIWFCKIGESRPDVANPDQIMRNAVRDAYRAVTDCEPGFIFSGWCGELTEPERAVVENRLPIPEATPPADAAHASGCPHAAKDYDHPCACGVESADAALSDEVTENLVALVGRLSHQLSKATPGHRLPVKAMAYLEQIGFKFHVARHGGPEAATQGKEPETIWRWYALDHTGYCYGANHPSNLPERCCLTAFHRHMDATEAAAALRARAVPEGFSLVENSALSTARMALAHATTEHGELYREAYEKLLAASKAAEGK